jgi:ATP-dependent helicase/DNAse subunit B
VLRLGRDEEDDYELNALEGGELIHEILHRIVERIDFSDAKRAPAEAAKVLAEIHDARLPRARDPGFFEAGWRSIATTVRAFVELELAYRAAHPSLEIHAEHEIDFTLAGAPDLAHPPMRILGRIDRVELRPRGRAIEELCVIDYKNSRNADKYGKAADPDGASFGWTDFQLPVYLMGALREFGSRLSPDAALRAGYVVLRSRDKKRKQAMFPVARDLLDHAPGGLPRRAKRDGPLPIPDRILALRDDALAGRFDVDPRQCDEWCPYRIVCRYYKSAEP